MPNYGKRTAPTSSSRHTEPVKQAPSNFERNDNMPDDDFMELGDSGFYVGEKELFNPKTGETIKSDDTQEAEDPEDEDS